MRCYKCYFFVGQSSLTELGTNWEEHAGKKPCH